MSGNTRVLVIAEAGVNHNGSLEQAKALVDKAKISGADIVKFQTFKAENLVTKTATKARYQAELTGASESQFDMLKRLELSFDEFLYLAEYCQKKEIEFLSTAFDEECLDFLVHKAGIKRIKIPSGELTNGPLLAACSRKSLPLILSTGMSTLPEIEVALDVIAWERLANGGRGEPIPGQFFKAQKPLDITLLHCTTEYPTPVKEINLRAIHTIASKFGLSTGFSDHSEGILAPVAAVAMGATLIEKHFTLSKTLPGPDHKASLDPDELNSMVAQIRLVEVMLGTGFKVPSTSEGLNSQVARKSLVAKKPIKVGELFSVDNLAVKRPGTGISPMSYWNLLGRKSLHQYESDQLLDGELV